MTEFRTDTVMSSTLQLETMGFPVELSNFGGIIKEIRRVSDPDKAQIIWDGIKTVRAQKQIPALPRLSRYMHRNYKLDKDTTQRLLDLAVEDNLIKLHKKVGTKGNKAGVEEDAYRLPTEDMLAYEEHDWYCFHCHSGGEVVLCRDCHRVYHQGCLKEELMEHMSFVCNYCRSFQSLTVDVSDDVKKDLNHLLTIVTNRCREVLSGNILARAPPPPAKNPYLTSDRKATIVKIIGEGGIVNSADREAFASFGEEKWRSKFLLKRHIDLEEVTKNCEGLKYRSVEEYRADIQNIVHNVVIYHGNHSHMADMAKQMFRGCSTDLNELLTCKDCFRYAHNRGDKYWFAKPCRPAHQIVYAQQAGYPYWPAKVLSGNPPSFTADSHKLVDVRFFGGYHQRAKELYEKCCNMGNFFNNFVGDPFAGEKASLLLGNKFGQGGEEDSEDDPMDDGGQPGDPGTSLPQQEYHSQPQPRGPPTPIINPTSVLPPRSQLVVPSNRSAPPTKLRRIEPKPMDTLSHNQQATQMALQAQQQQQTLMPLLTVVTVPPGGSSVPQHIQPHSIHIQGTTTHINAQQLAAAAAAVNSPHHHPHQSPHPHAHQLHGPPPPSATPQPTHHQLQPPNSVTPGTPLHSLSSHPGTPGTPHGMSQGGAATPQHITQYAQSIQQPAISQHQQQQSGGGNNVQQHNLQAPTTPIPQHALQQQQLINQTTFQSLQQLQPLQQQAQPPASLMSSMAQQTTSMLPPMSTTPGVSVQVSSAMPTIPQDTLSHLLSPQHPATPITAATTPNLHSLLPPLAPTQPQQLHQPAAPPTTINNSSTTATKTTNVVASQNNIILPPTSVIDTKMLIQPPTTQQQQQTHTDDQLLKPGEVKVKEEIITEEMDDAVSSSSNLTRFVSVGVQTPNKLLRMVAEEICGQSRHSGGKASEKDFKEFAEKLRAEFDQEKKRAVNVATRSLERDLERLKADHVTEMEAFAEKAKAELAESKRKQWCYNCEEAAIYWCCWNTAYCSTECQQEHWRKEHKKDCRRK